MVFHGGFSKGCQTCRTRRIKCDEARPVCAKCIKSKRKCLGYRDETDLLFRNETTATAMRANRKASPGTASNCSRPTPPTDRPAPFEDQFVAPNNAPCDVSEQLAIDSLFTNFVHVARRSTASRGYLDFLPEIYAAAKPDSALSSATAALAFAVLDRHSPTRNYLPRARLRYGEALSRVHEAIRDPIAAKQNETLMAILLFGLIESITALPGSMPRWGIHSDAARSLIKMRGKEMLQDDISLNLLFTVRTQMIGHHIHRSIPLADFFDDNDPTMISWADVPPCMTANPIHLLTNITIAIPNLRALAADILSLPNIEANLDLVLDLVRRAEEVDRNLFNWPSTIPTFWQHRSVNIDPATNIQSGFEEVVWDPCPGITRNLYYEDIWVASHWDTYRSSRIMVQAVIIRCGAWLANCSVADLRFEDIDSSFILASKCLHARNVILELLDDICASVPFHVGPLCDPFSSPISSPPGSPDSNAVFNAPLGGYFLVWPLFIARSVIIAPAHQRAWIQATMGEVAKRYSINIAAILATMHGNVAWPVFEARPIYKIGGLRFGGPTAVAMMAMAGGKGSFGGFGEYFL